jgi:type IV fimbrial biogenesis protein FimT
MMGGNRRNCRTTLNRLARERAPGRLPEQSSSAHGAARQGGYTLFELMTVVAVVGVLAAFAIPSFTSIIISNRLSSMTNLLIGSIREAQIEGIRHNGSPMSGYAQFCSNSATNNATSSTDNLGLACGTSLGTVIYDQLVAGGSHTYPQVQVKASIPSSVSVGDGTNGTTAAAALRFGANGLASAPTGSGPYSGLVADVYSTSISTNNHRCIYMATGSQLSTCIVTGGIGACNATTEPTNCQQQFQQK